jgi:hypothetical protein
MDDDKELPTPELDLDKDDKGGGEAEVPQEDDLEDADLEDAAELEEGEGEEGEEQPEEDQRGRASARISKLANERKAERERAEKAERDVAALRQQMEEVQRRLQAPPQVDPNAEAELLAQMDPVQRVQYESQKQINMLQSQIRSVQLASIDSADKAQFLSNLSPKELAIRQKYLPKVEEALADMRKKGLNAPREDIFDYVRGKAMREAERKANKGLDATKEAARTRVTNTQGRTTSVRSDAPSGRKGKSAEERLENVIL